MKALHSKFAALSGAALALVGLAVFVSSSHAQGTASAQPPQFTGPARPNMAPIPQPAMPFQTGQFQAVAPPAPAMVEDSGHLYILEGFRLIKVRKSDLTVEAEAPLRRPPGGTRPRPGTQVAPPPARP